MLTTFKILWSGKTCSVRICHCEVVEGIAGVKTEKERKKGNAMQQLAKAYILIGTSYRNIFSYSLKKTIFTDHNSIISCNALTGPTFTSETRK